MRSMYKKGFTVPEMMIVIGIISIFAAIVFTGYSKYRERARDAVREVDIERLAVTMRLYIEQYGSDMDCEGGLKIDGNMTVVSYGGGPQDCDDGAQILQFIANEHNGIPHDPLGPGNLDYYYYFDNWHQCAAGGASNAAAMLFAVNLESQDTNAVTVCGSHEGAQGGYLRTTDYGGTLTASQPYVRLVTRSRETW